MITNLKKIAFLLSVSILLFSCGKNEPAPKTAAQTPPASSPPKVDVSTLAVPTKSYEQSCKDGDLQAIQYFVETGKGSVAQPFQLAKTPLHWAAASRHPEAVRYLLDKGGAPNQVDDDQFTPLHMCAMWGDSVSCKMLIKAGSVLYAQDNNRMTPLHLSAMKANKETTLALVQSGADINAENENKWTPFRVADYSKKTTLESKAPPDSIKKEVAKIDDYMNFLRLNGATK